MNVFVFHGVPGLAVLGALSHEFSYFGWFATVSAYWVVDQFSQV